MGKALVQISLAAVFVGVLGMLHSPGAVAQGDDFAGCQNSQTEVINSGKFMAEDVRMANMERILSDLTKVSEELAHPKHDNVTPSFLDKCRNNKQLSFNALVNNASATSRDQANFQMMVATFIDEQTQHTELNISAAIKSYLSAADKDPRRYEALNRAFELWWESQQSKLADAAKNVDVSGSKKSSEKLLNQSEMLLRESSRYIDPILKNTSAPRELKARLLARRAVWLSLASRDVEASAEWKKVLEYDPNDPAALHELALYNRTRGLNKEARAYTEKLAGLKPDLLFVQKELLMYQIEDEDYKGALQTVQTAKKAAPTDLSLYSFEAVALVGSGQMDRGVALMKKVVAKNPKEPSVARNRALVLRMQGDTYMQNDQPGLALQAFHQALALNPKDFLMTMKITEVYFRYHENHGFKPEVAVKKDMDEILHLLDPFESDKEFRESQQSLQIRAYARSTAPKRGVRACDRYLAENAASVSSTIVGACVAIYNSAGMKARANELDRSHPDRNRSSDTPAAISIEPKAIQKN